MKKSCMQSKLLKFSKKKLNIFKVCELYITLLKIPYNDTTFIKLFLNNYYNIDNFPEEFYRLFVYNVHSNRYKKLFDILQTRNIFDLISFLKQEETEDIEKIINPVDYFNLPSKQINFLISLIKSLNVENNELKLKKIIAKDPQWQLRRKYISNEKEYLKIAIKMFLSVGMDNSIDILNGKYGQIDYDIIYFLFNNLNVINKDDKSNKVFNEFLFNNKKDSNNNMRLLLEGKSIELFINFDYFYNSIEFYIQKLGNKLNRNKVSILLKERFLSPRIDNPELSGDILEDMISSYYHKYGITDSESEIIQKNMDAYNLKLKTKTNCSIIKTDIPKEGEFIFELLPLNDARNLVIGYRTGNCFRINGDAFILFDNFLTNPHMRILTISTEEYKDFGMVLLMRNGNVLIAQGIEISNRVPNTLNSELLYNAVKNAVNYIMNEMNKNNDEIVASIIGLSNNNTIPYNQNILPFIINPIINSNSSFYNGIDNYQGLLSLKEGKNIKDIKLFIPDIKYYDNSDIIYKRDISTFHQNSDYNQIEKILISLRYARFKITPREKLIYYYSDLLKKHEIYTECTYNWFIMLFEDGTIDSFINTDNPEINREYSKRLELIKNKKVKKRTKKLLQCDIDKD